MAKRIYPTYWRQWLKKTAINPGGKYYPPTVVFVTHVSKHGRLVGETLNSGVVYVGRPCQLIEYSPRLFIRLTAAWKLKDAKRVIEANKNLVLTGIIQ